MLLVSNRGPAPTTTGGLVPALKAVSSQWLTIAEMPLSPSLWDGHYHQTCNRTFWPMCLNYPHLFRHSRMAWADYLEANRMMADRLHADETVWLHDFHVAMVPAFLPRRRLGFFWHVPFPTPDAWAWLPPQHAHDLVLSLARCRLVGFQTERDRGLYMAVAGKEAAKTVVSPVGVDTTTTTTPFPSDGRKLVLGVDRIDLAKGLLAKLTAFDLLLARHPHWQGKVVFHQIAVPSREVPEYLHLQGECAQLAAEINERYACRPVRFVVGALPREEVNRWYATADVCFVAPYKDGMNLVAQEYAVCGPDRGHLLLSVFAGAASVLSGYCPVNPYDIDGMVDALNRALSEDGDLPTVRASVVSSAQWASRFLATLEAS